MFLGTGHVFTFSTFSGLAEIPFARQNVTQKEYTSIKELALLRLDLQIVLFQPIKY